MIDHISTFKKIVVDLETMEVKYNQEDLGMILLCSFPSSYTSFRDTILYSHKLLLWKRFLKLYVRKKR